MSSIFLLLFSSTGEGGGEGIHYFPYLETERRQHKVDLNQNTALHGLYLSITGFSQ